MVKKYINNLGQYFQDVGIECYMVCVYLLCLPFTIVSTPFGSLLKVVTMPVIAVLAYKLFFGKAKLISFNSVHLTYTLYMLYSVAGLILLHTADVMVITQDMCLAYATVMLVTMRVYTPNEKRLIDASWILLGLICIYIAFFYTKQYSDIETRVYVLIGNNQEDPNQFCAYFIMPMVLCVREITKKSKLSPLYYIMIILMIYSILRGGSRGGMVAIVFAVAAYVFIGIKTFGKRLAMVIAGALCVVLIVTVIFPILPENVQERYSIQSVLESGGTGRFDLWQYLFEHTIEEPERIIRGSGIMSTAETLANSTVTHTARGAHNQFVQVFADQGIIGVLLYLIWSAACIFRNIKRNPEYSAAYLGLMALAVSLTFYTFKPLVNIVLMCALTVGTNDLKTVEGEIEK